MSTYKYYVYWPDVQFRQAPSDGYVHVASDDTFMWDGMLKAWVSGWGGKIVDFTPSHTLVAVSAPVKCECGGDKVPDSGHSDWCPKAKELEK